MSNPGLLIQKQKLQENAQKIVGILREQQVQYHLVTKAFSADTRLIEALHEVGIDHFADSRVQNLRRLRPYAKSLLLTRIPMISEASEVVALADISLNSSLKTLQALDAAAAAQNKRHQVIIMLELGDLREGIPVPRLPYELPDVMALEHLDVIGIGANFNCYGGVIPQPDTLHALMTFKEDLEFEYERSLPLISAGNSGSLHLLLNQQWLPGINHLRIGEAYLLGRETSFGKRVQDLHEDVFTLRAELVEVYEKPSVPIGQVGLNAAGETPQFKEEGEILRGIFAMGGQDVIPDGLTPLLPGLTYLGNSQDHTIFKLTGAAATLEVGDTVDFRPNYVNLVRAFSSEYVDKIII